MTIFKLVVFCLFVASLLGACTFEAIKPWDRDLLAKESMQLIPFPVEAGIDDHIYFSKEASSGGQSVGGGGCGCN